VEQWFVDVEHARFLGRMRQRQISRFYRHLYHCYCKIKTKIKVKIFQSRKGHGSRHLLLIGYPQQQVKVQVQIYTQIIQMSEVSTIHAKILQVQGVSQRKMKIIKTNRDA
jgi:hypothetical protein